MLVAVALFALISLAGLALITSVLDVRSRTEGRIGRLGEVERALTLLSTDLIQAEAGTVVSDGARVRFVRTSSGDRPAQTIVYEAMDGVLERRFVGVSDKGRPQTVLAGVLRIEWRFLTETGDWLGAWPAAEGEGLRTARAARADITFGNELETPTGVLTRTIELARPP